MLSVTFRVERFAFCIFYLKPKFFNNPDIYLQLCQNKCFIGVYSVVGELPFRALDMYIPA